MKQISSILILIVIFQMEAFAQIPNGGFEDWTQIQNFEKPLLWETNQDSNFVRFVKDTNSVEGNYSLKIIPSSYTAWQECMSYSWTGINLQLPIGENKSLTFYAKSIPDTLNQFESVFLRIQGKLFSGGDFESNYEWEIFEPIYDFTKIQIPITNQNIDSLTIQIFGGALNGVADGCPNRSFSWIDGMEIAETEITNSSFELILQGKSISIFPNPSNGIIELGQTSHKIKEFHLYSIEGKLIEYGSLSGTTIKLKIKHNGIFFLRLIGKNQSFEITKKIKIE